MNNNHKCKYQVKTVCQGDLRENKEFDSLIKAVLYYCKKVKRYGKYGTMNFTLYAV